MSQSKVKVYNVTLDGVIIHYRQYIIDIPNAIDTTEYYSSIPSHSLHFTNHTWRSELKKQGAEVGSLRS